MTKPPFAFLSADRSRTFRTRVAHPLARVAMGVLALPLPFAAQASETRVTSMARPAGLEDEAFVFAYPSLVTKHSLAIAELGTPTPAEAYAGAIAQAPYGGVGIFLSRDQSLFSYRNAGTLSTDVPDQLHALVQNLSLVRKGAALEGFGPERPLDIFFGRALEGDTGFGVRVTLAGDTENIVSDATFKRNAQQLDVHGGYHMPLGAGRLDLGLMLGLVGKIEQEAEPAGGTKSSTTYDRGVEVRLIARHTSTSTERFRPYYKGGFGFVNPTIEAKTGGTSEDRRAKDLVIDAQAGALFQVAEQVLLTGGLGAFYFTSEGPYAIGAAPAAATPAGVAQALRTGSETLTKNLTGEKTKRTGYGVLTNLGAEAMTSENWGLLGGVQYALWGRLVTTDGFAAGKPKYTTNLAATTDAALYVFGVFFKREALRIDASAALKGFLHNGPNFITGGTTAPILGQIAATYRF